MEATVGDYPTTLYPARCTDLDVNIRRGPVTQNVEVFTTFGANIGTLDESQPVVPTPEVPGTGRGWMRGRYTGALLPVDALLDFWHAMGVEVEA
jgi:hypothetical protein